MSSILTINHVNDFPAEPTGNTLYASKDAKNLTEEEAVGWRITVVPNTGLPLTLFEVDFYTDNSVTSTLFSSTVDSGNISNLEPASGITSGIIATGPFTIGRVFNTATPVYRVDLLSNVDQFASVTVSFSKDTTNGLDGTWEEPKESTNLTWTGNATRASGPFGYPKYASMTLSNPDASVIASTLSYENIQFKVQEVIAGEDRFETVATFADLDPTDYTTSTLVYVEDATADPLVELDGAVYFFNINNDTFTLLNADESGLVLEEAQW